MTTPIGFSCAQAHIVNKMAEIVTASVRRENHLSLSVLAAVSSRKYFKL